MSPPLNRAEQALARLTPRQRLAVQALCALGTGSLEELADEMGDDDVKNTRYATRCGTRGLSKWLRRAESEAR